jgi:hypothetical protein
MRDFPNSNHLIELTENDSAVAREQIARRQLPPGIVE